MIILGKIHLFLLCCQLFYLKFSILLVSSLVTFSDLPSSILQEAQSYAADNGLFFMETSAKSAANVNDIFYEIGMGALFGLLLLSFNGIFNFSMVV